MKALSVRQPWAWAEVRGFKPIENRGRNIVGAYRGPLLIHAAKICSVRQWAGAAQFIATRLREQGRTGVSMPLPHAIDRGGIVGRARIAAVLGPDGDFIGEQVGRFSFDLAWWNRGCYGIVLADVEALPFMPWRGALGLFEVPDDYAVRSLAPEAPR